LTGAGLGIPNVTSPDIGFGALFKYCAGAAENFSAQLRQQK
jgi:hypothetical protein